MSSRTIVAEVRTACGGTEGFCDVPPDCKVIRYGGVYYALDFRSQQEGYAVFVQTHAFIPHRGLRKDRTL